MDIHLPIEITNGKFGKKPNTVSLPREARRVRLGDVCRIVHGKNQRLVESKDGLYPIYGSGGQIGRAAEYLCPADTVIIGRKGTINRPLFIREPFWNVDTAFGLVANQDFLLPEFLFCFCLDFDFSKLNKATTIPSLTKKDIANIEMSLPSLDKQQEAVKKVSSVLGLVRTFRCQLTLFDELVKSRFIEMFGDPDNNPNGCSVRRLGDVVSIERGGSPRPISQYVTSGEDGVNWIKIGDTSENSIYITKTEEKIKPSGMKKSRYVQPGDFLLSNSMSFGRPYILKTDGCIHDGWLVLRDSSSAFDKLYLYALLDSEYAKRFFAKKAVGTTVRNLNKEIVGNMPVLLPPSEKQIEYADFFTRVDKLRFDALRQRGPVLTMLSKCGEFPEMIEIKYAEIGKMNKIKSANFGEWDVQKKDLQQTPHMEKAILRQHRPTC